MAESRLPLIVDYRPTRHFAWRQGRFITQSEALAGIRQLARELEADSFYINLCEDRYLFTLAFAAVCLSGGTNLLPQSGAEGVLSDLREDYPRAGILDDDRVAAYIDHPLDRSEQPAAPYLDADHLAAIVFTSGSTGRPSPQAKYWGNLHTGTDLCRRRFFTGQQTLNIAATVPPQHMYGLETSVLTVLQAGFAAHAARPFMPWEIAATLAEIPEPRLLITTPIHLRTCIEAEVDMPALDKVICATAPLSRDLASAVEQAWNTEVHEIYGCTEAGSLASRHTVRDYVWRLYDGMRLESASDGFYLHGPHLTQAVPLSDNLELIDERHFHLLGRSTDMIKLAGKRLSLNDLTRQLLAIDGVQDAVVFVPRNSNDRQRPAALIVAPQMEVHDVAAQLSTRIDPVFVPRPLLRVPELPRNAVGKLPRTDLEALLRETRRQSPSA